MKTRVRKRSFLDVLREHLLSMVFFVVIFGMFIGGVKSAENSAETEGRRILEENLNKAIVSCYSLEGAYPQNIDYLKENYGFIYDEEKYAINYIAFADNIMPDITIIELPE
ncbi:MAG: hypothetical protein PUD72_01310 [Oscillospiraceae bacterium]|nr:hypothetical protein [Oscillospiraceae bacterium]